MSLDVCLLLSAALFCVGLYGLLSHRHAIGLLLSVEIMANAANINLVAFARYRADSAGQILALFAIALTVAEVVVGLAIVILLHRARHQARVDVATDFQH